MKPTVLVIGCGMGGMHPKLVEALRREVGHVVNVGTIGHCDHHKLDEVIEVHPLHLIEMHPKVIIENPKQYGKRGKKGKQKKDWQ
jgi:hypothetical protein